MNRVLASEEQRNAGTKPCRADIIAFVSGRSGVGKTSLSVNLAIQLARRGRSVVILPMDGGPAGPDVVFTLGLPTGFPGFAAAQPDRSQSGEEALLLEGPAGIRILWAAAPGARAENAESSWQVQQRTLDTVATTCDAVLVDCPCGSNRATVAWAAASDLLILLTTPEPGVLVDSYAALKLLMAAGSRGASGRTALVVNMAHSRRDADAAASRLARAAREFLGLSLENLGFIPYDRHVGQAARRRLPVTLCCPRSPASACIDRICQRLLAPRQCGVLRTGVWSRVAGLFL